jgi:hypothetical protein
MCKNLLIERLTVFLLDPCVVDCGAVRHSVDWILVGHMIESVVVDCCYSVF